MYQQTRGAAQFEGKIQKNKKKSNDVNFTQLEKDGKSPNLFKGWG